MEQKNWLLHPGDAVGLVCCSDGHASARKRTNDILQKVLESFGLRPVWSPYIYAREAVFSGSGKERAEALNDFYRDPEIRMIFDLSGGNAGNGVLEYLDYECIRNNPKPFFGYSDLTTVHQAIIAKTGNKGGLYQLRNLVAQEKEIQQKRFYETFFEGKSTLWDASYHFLRGEKISGVVNGGNLRCLLKLAGTPYWPDLSGKILFLEALGGGVGEITAMLTQLRQIGVFSRIRGLLLGTFTQMEKEELTPTVPELVLRITEDYDFPVAQTREIGHGANSKGLILGGTMELNKKETEANGH